MTREEIDLIFPPSYGGIAQVSDLRLLLSKLSLDDSLGGIDYYEVNTLEERDELENVKDASICKVIGINTYIYDVDTWKILVENTGGGGPTGIKVTENFTVSTIDEMNQYKELLYIPNSQDHIFVFLNGMYLMLGSAFDYTISNNRIYFSNPITAGDNLSIKYSRL